jgi:serine/threonine-protein kinase RsbW
MSLATTDNTLRISSHPNNIRYIETFVERLAEEHTLSKEQYGNILVSLTEAVNNAILHGNHSDERKKVLVRAQRSRRTLAILVEDEGCGFDHRTLPDPTKPENLHQIGGRGVFVMHELCDSVRYYRNGCAVELGFKL